VSIRQRTSVAAAGPAARLERALSLLADPPRSGRDASGAKRESRAGRVENLVVEFDEAYTAFIESCDVLPGESQLEAVQRVDARLSSMVRAADASLWTERSHRESDGWSEVRRLAAAAMRAFGWAD
jgi:hypothetical protein